MTHVEILEAVAKKTGLSKTQSEGAIKAYLETVEEALITDLDVRLLGVGTLKIKAREARVGVNPKTKEKIQIAPAVALTLSPSKGFKEKINTVLTVEGVKAKLEEK